MKDRQRASPAGRLAILDDIFPHPGSAFRFEEFCTYLDEMPEVEIYSTGAALHFADETRPIDALITDYGNAHPRHAGRLHPLTGETFPAADLYYGVFLHILHAFIDHIEHQNAPFAFTLYPGGSFALNDAGSDARLRRVLGAPGFRNVIATQPVTRDYLLQHKFCRDDQIVSLFGGVLPRYGLAPPLAKARYGYSKDMLDLCFVANRYSATGADKGYDLFVGMAQALSDLGTNARFHVVGRYDDTILDLGSAGGRFAFYGPQRSEFFRTFYAGMDAIVSPTRPFVLGSGKFDGFPTGCSVEAGLQEVAVLCTDELALNQDYEPGRDLVIVRPNVGDIVSAVLVLARRPDALAELGVNARRRMLDLYGPARQMRPRLALLRSLLRGEAAAIR